MHIWQCICSNDKDVLKFSWGKRRCFLEENGYEVFVSFW